MENNNKENLNEKENEIKIIENPERKRNRKKMITAIIALTINISLIASIFATGYFFGSSGSFLDTVLAELKSDNREVDKILEEKKDDSRIELTTQEIAKLVGPAVVGIVTEVSVVNQFWGTTGSSESSGSGIIFQKDGSKYYIITNNHVVEGANKLSIHVAGDRAFDGEIVGTDVNTDLAVVRITCEDALTVAKFGDSSKVEVGEKAVAIGNPLGMEFFGSITQGIISATNRKVKMNDDLTMNYLQTDAAINSGNSGGALVNAYGEVIGVNSAKISASSVEGMGFAIPISEAVVVANDLVKYGYVKGRPVIGITTVDVTPSVAKRYGWPEGVWVNSVLPGSGAQIGGLVRGDIIIEANGKTVRSVTELNAIKNTLKPGDNLKLKVYRENKGELNVIVKLTEDNPLNSK